ncbi:MAG: hypothetical protein OES32_13590 [Acidobacteriota bacterium]|nr:hypothetical protein [Acidobacteriota bacterium]MDH3524612.1 hypothetical protein [Acidobacteriota bacterium]
MALDIALIGAAGRPEDGIQIAVEPHHRLMSLSREADLPLLGRMEDYYDDVDFGATELEDLLRESCAAVCRSYEDEELLEILLGLQRLICAALRRNTGLAVIAD